MADLLDVTEDSLLAAVRLELRKKHGYPAGEGHLPPKKRQRVPTRWGVPCVYSLERDRQKPEGEGTHSSPFAVIKSRHVSLPDFKFLRSSEEKQKTLRYSTSFTLK